MPVTVSDGGLGCTGLNPFSSTPFRDSMMRNMSLGMGKLESMELPDPVAAVAMLHDMQEAVSRPPGASNPPPPASITGRPPPSPQRISSPAHALVQPAPLNGQGLPRANSGLESMQSIEQALGDVQHVMDKVAEEWKWIDHAGQVHTGRAGRG